MPLEEEEVGWILRRIFISALFSIGGLVTNWTIWYSCIYCKNTVSLCIRMWATIFPIETVKVPWFQYRICNLIQTMNTPWNTKTLGIELWLLQNSISHSNDISCTTPFNFQSHQLNECQCHCLIFRFNFLNWTQGILRFFTLGFYLKWESMLDAGIF